MRNPIPPRRLVSGFAVAVGCTLTLAACGSSSASKSDASAGSGIKFAACMRAHGVPNFPDPSGGGGGIKIPIGSGIDPFSPAFKAAQSDCKRLLPGGGPPSGPPSAHQKAQMFALSQCMRAHGITEFPDPVTSPPQNISDAAVAFGRPGLFLVVPNTIDVQSPAFKHAAQACHFPGA